MELTDELQERIDDAIESAMLHHEALPDDSACTCGFRNNMDGDLLFTHRFCEVSFAVSQVWTVNDD